MPTARSSRATLNDPQKLGRPILDLLGPSQPLTTFGAAAGTLEITLPDGATALATVRGAAQSARRRRGRADGKRRAHQLARHHRAHHHALGDDRLRRADPRLRLSLAGDARARSRSHPRHRARPHRYRAQPRALRLVGLGPGARPGVLVALDVRPARPAGAGRSLDLRRAQRAGASGRHRSLWAAPGNLPTPKCNRSITPSACGMPTAAGSGCGCAANWRVRRAKRDRI